MPGGNSFIKMRSKSGKVVGESRQKEHDGEIEIDDFNWEVTSDTSFTKGGGASVGKAMPGVCSWSHYYDTASPMIMLNCVIGTSFPEVVATMCKQTGSAQPEVYFTATMTDAYITKATIGAGEDGSVKQSVEMVFKSLTIAYQKQEDNGTLNKSKKSFKWDIPTMVANVE